jgi:hypothetical protein
MKAYMVSSNLSCYLPSMRVLFLLILIFIALVLLGSCFYDHKRLKPSQTSYPCSSIKDQWDTSLKGVPLFLRSN